jgi:hypothetical protein
MQILFKDYVRCVDQLMMLRAVIQLATDITFDFEGDRAYGRRGAALTFELIEKVKWHGESTLHCLKACLMDSAAVRVIEQQAEASRSGLPRDAFYKSSYAEFLDKPEEILVIGGIPHATEVVDLQEPETETYSIEVMPYVEVAGFGGELGVFSARRRTSTRVLKLDEEHTRARLAHEQLPSVDDLVRRWTNISSNDTVVESSAASTSGSSL